MAYLGTLLLEPVIVGKLQNWCEKKDMYLMSENTIHLVSSGIRKHHTNTLTTFSSFFHLLLLLFTGKHKWQLIQQKRSKENILQ